MGRAKPNHRDWRLTRRMLNVPRAIKDDFGLMGRRARRIGWPAASWLGLAVAFLAAARIDHRAGAPRRPDTIVATREATQLIPEFRRRVSDPTTAARIYGDLMRAPQAPTGVINCPMALLDQPAWRLTWTQRGATVASAKLDTTGCRLAVGLPGGVRVITEDLWKDLAVSISLKIAEVTGPFRRGESRRGECHYLRSSLSVLAPQGWWQ